MEKDSEDGYVYFAGLLLWRYKGISNAQSLSKKETNVSLYKYLVL